MNNNRRQLYYALSAAVVGVFCAAFLIFLGKHAAVYFSRAASEVTSEVASRISHMKWGSSSQKQAKVPIGTAENPALAKPMTPEQQQALENLDEDATSTNSAVTQASYSRSHAVTATQYLVIDLTDDNTDATNTAGTASAINAFNDDPNSGALSPFVLSSRTILQKDPARGVPIASLTKLVTAVVAENILDQNEPIAITQDILNTDGNTAGFRLGEKFNPPELYYPLLMVSSNDAGEALAQADSAGRADFIRQMNEWVESIGAYHTYFADPTGLSPDNTSTADDLAIIMRWIYKNRPNLIAITDTKVKLFRTHTWTNPTQLLNLSSYLGGKNGYIPQSGETAVSLFQVGNKLFAVVVLGSSNRDQDILELMREATGVPYITYETPTKTSKAQIAAD